MAKSKNKTVATDASVTDFLNNIADEQKRQDSKEICEMMRELSGEEPKMWGSIVGFGQYHYKYDSGREGDAVRTGFSPRAKNLTVYIMPGYQDLGDKLERLGKHKLGKSCLYINKLADVDKDVLKEIIQFGLDEMDRKYPRS